MSNIIQLESFKKDETFSVSLDVRLKIKNFCDRESFEQMDISLGELLKRIIDAEGLHGVVEDEYLLLDVNILEE